MAQEEQSSERNSVRWGWNTSARWRGSYDVARHVGAVLAAVVVGFGVAVAPWPLAILAGGVVLTFIRRGWLLAGAIVLSRPLPGGVLPVGSFSPADVLLATWVVRTLAVSPGGLRFAAGANALVGFLLWAWTSVILVGGQPLALGRITLYALVALVGSGNSGNERKAVHRVIVGYAFVELVFTAPQLMAFLTGEGTSANLLGVTVRDPHLFGFLLVAAYCLIRGEAVRVGPRWARRSLQLALFLGAAATMRRSIWLALVVVVVLPRVRSQGPLRVALLSIGIAVGAWFVYSPVTQWFELNEESRSVRVAAAEVSVEAIGASPLLGVGWGSLGKEERSAGVAYQTGYNLPTYVAASAGLPGALLLLGWIVAVGRLLWWRRPAVFWWFLALSLSSTASQPIYAGSMVTIMLFVLIGLEASPGKVGRRPNSAQATVPRHLVQRAGVAAYRRGADS